MSHVEWAITREVDPAQPLRWSAQPLQPGMSRCEVAWRGNRGAATRVASALRGFPNLRYEITEDSPQGLGERFSCTPALGLFRAQTAPSGDVVVGEERLRAALAAADVAAALREALGQRWDDELEPFRMAGDDRVRWLTRVG
jgi:hypothetical protein